jgi:hypothetical protein
MRYLESKRIVFLFLLFLSITLVSCLPMAATDELSQQDLTPSPTFTKIAQPTKTFVSTITPTVTESRLPAQIFTLTVSATIPAPVQATNTSVPIISPTKTKPEPSVPTVTSTPTLLATVTLVETPTLTLTAQFCAPPTPEPLWVDPVTSPTDQLSQIITVYIGFGKEVTITTESGEYTVTGNFSAYITPAVVEISLLPNTINHIQITAKVISGGNGCTYSYTLTTTRDKNGDPLEIVQGQATP